MVFNGTSPSTGISSTLGFEQVVDAVLALVEQRTGRRPVVTA